MQAVAENMELPLPNVITVPASGLPEKELFERLRLSSTLVYPLIGRLLEFPHDVRYASRPAFATHYFTADGVRLLVDHFRLNFLVVEQDDCSVAGNDGYTRDHARVSRRDARPWWVREGLA